MCTNYRAPNEDPGISELKLGISDLYRRDPWNQDVYPDYAAAIVCAAGGDAEAVKTVFGFWPKFMQPERRDGDGRKKRPFDTVNARSETVGSSRLYGKAWRDGQRCLIPAAWIYEPCYETGRNVWHRIGLTGWQPYCVAGIWKRYEDADGRSLIGMAMLTVNADGHLVMGRMHKPNDEKRSVVILRPVDYDEWLHTTNVEAARSDAAFASGGRNDRGAKVTCSRECTADSIKRALIHNERGTYGCSRQTAQAQGTYCRIGYQCCI